MPLMIAMAAALFAGGRAMHVEAHVRIKGVAEKPTEKET